MRFEVGKEAFENAVNKVYKGVGNMGLIMITTIIGIEGRDGDLILTSTDNARNLEVRINGILPQDIHFYTATGAAMLKALVSKTDSATITFDVKEDRIVFNGGYSANLEIAINDEDSSAGPAKIRPIIVEGEGKSVKVADLKMFLSYLKATLPEKPEKPEYLAYRVKNGMAMTYDSFGSNLVEIGLDGVDISIPPAIVSLFELFEEDDATITVSADGSKVKINTETVSITGALRPDVAKFDLDRFTKIIYSDTLFNTEAVLDKGRLISILNRLELFVDKGKSSAFDLEVSPESLLVTSLDKNFVEKIDFESSNLTTNIQRSIGLNSLKATISALRGDKVVINFGVEGGGLRITENKAHMVIAYLKRDNKVQ